MRVAAAIIILVAVMVGVAPQFMDCQSQGKAIELPNGMSLPMKCHWTARAEMALAVPLLLCGVSMLVCRRSGSCRQQAVLVAALGLSVVLLPTVLIGVCAAPDMACRALMKPVLILAGLLVVALGAVCFVLAGRQHE
jgi:cytochrome bd-type quinol oxidase subunit 2